MILPNKNLCMRGSRNIRQGGSSQSDKKSSDNIFFFFLVLSLFYRSQMVNFKEIYHFSRFQRVSDIFQGGTTFCRGGGSNCLFPMNVGQNIPGQTIPCLFLTPGTKHPASICQPRQNFPCSFCHPGQNIPCHFCRPG